MSAWESIAVIVGLVCLTTLLIQRAAFKHEIAKRKEGVK